MFSRILTVLIVTFVFTSCSSDDGEFRNELNRNRSLWQSKNITNYTWNERLSCFCAGVLERDVIVENGIKVKVVFDEDYLYEGLTYEDVFNDSKTVEDAFDFIERLLMEDLGSLSIEYDDVYGFPKSIDIDYIKDAVDDEISYLYTDFEVTNN